MPIRLTTGSSLVDAWFLLHQTYQSLLKCEEEIFLKTELSLQQFHVLHTIIINDNTAMPVAVANWLDRNPNSITLIIDRLEKRGFVKRERDLKDRRATRLVVTPKGTAAFNKARISFDELRKLLMSDLSEHELLELIRLLNIIREKCFDFRDIKNKIKAVNNEWV